MEALCDFAPQIICFRSFGDQENACCSISRCPPGKWIILQLESQVGSLLKVVLSFFVAFFLMIVISTERIVTPGNAFLRFELIRKRQSLLQPIEVRVWFQIKIGCSQVYQQSYFNGVFFCRGSCLSSESTREGPFFCAQTFSESSISKPGSRRFIISAFKFILGQWQLNNKFRAFAGCAIYSNISAMPLHHNIITQRQAKPCALASGLGGKERLHDLFFYAIGNTNASLCR